MFILLHGKDEFSAHEELARLRADAGYAHNQDIFSGADTPLATIRNICDTMPFLSDRRLVVVEGLPKPKRSARAAADADDGPDAEGDSDDAPAEPAAEPKAARGKKKSGGEDGPKKYLQGLADYAPNVPEETTLVVLLDQELEATNPLLRAAQTHGTVKAFHTPQAKQLDSWIAKRVKARSASITPEAAQLLAEAIGAEQLRVLAGEIDKLSTYVGVGGEIDAAVVTALTPMVRELNAFALTDALLRRDRTRALALLHELLDDGDAPLKIVGMIAYQTRTLMQVQALAARGLRSFQIAQTAGIAPFAAEKALKSVRQFSRQQLEASHRALCAVDTALKRSRMTPEMALDLLIIEFGMAGPDRPSLVSARSM